MNAPKFQVGDRVVITGNVPWSGFSCEVKEVNPPDYPNLWEGRNVYIVQIDTGSRSLQAESNLMMPTVRSRRR